MGLNIKLIQRFSKTKASDTMHSSGYASVENGSNFGASGNTSFAERQKIEQNRKVVQGYKNSLVANTGNARRRALSVEDQAKMAAEAAAFKSIAEADKGPIRTRQEFNARREEGGLRNYSTEHKAAMNTINRTASASSAREARAARFDNAQARPIPKTGGFGRH